MNRVLSVCALALCVASVWGQAPGAEGFGSYELERGLCITEEQRAAIQAKLSASVASLRAAGKLPSLQAQLLAVPPMFIWPVAANTNNSDFGFHGISNFVDQETNVASVLDWNCGSRTYDGHRGTDIFTPPFPWLKMDSNEVMVVAAAAGTIIGKADGYFDRTCVGSNFDWNAVYVQHSDGSVAWYGHLKKFSLTTNAVGSSVTNGQYLGIVGSSGFSSGPHLHFEVYDASNRLVDPWGGACNSKNTGSWWQVQRPYYDSAINKLSTHWTSVTATACSVQEIPNERRVFNPGESLNFFTFFRDQLAGDVASNVVVRPDGLTNWSWLITSPSYYSASYWYTWFGTTPSLQRGSWYFRSTYKGVQYEHRFFVGNADAGLSVTNTNGVAVAGSNLTFTLRVTNNTAAYATYLTVSNPLPAGCSFVSASSGGALGGGVVSWGVTGLAANASTTLSVTVLFTNTNFVAYVTNSARVATGTFDSNAVNDTASVVVPVDHDGDGIPSVLEGVGDSDGDGIPAYLDTGETFNVTSVSAGTLTTWAAFSGAVYQLQFTTNLLPPQTWLDFGGAVTALSSSLSVTDTNAAGQRSYRVKLQKLP